MHPQKWTPEHDRIVAGKKVALIGSGATAVTIFPGIKDAASHVTMVQRTPTYIVSSPEKDAVAQFLNNWLPSWMALRHASDPPSHFVTTI